MEKKKIEIEVFGADQVCASCVNLPSSKDTYEWLEAALSRKFPNQPFSIVYIDIFNPPELERHQDFARKMVEEDLFYPLVMIEDEIVAEGNVSLKRIVEIMESQGYEQNRKN